MALTGTVHPPAGATALLAVMDDDVAKLGWFLVPAVMLGCGIMLAVALLVNNIQRQFPLHWWTEEEVGSFWTRRQRGAGASINTNCGSDAGVLETKRGGDSTDVEACKTSQAEKARLVISRDGIVVPSDMCLRPEDRLWLESLRLRL